jgi:hypothetical protein
VHGKALVLVTRRNQSQKEHQNAHAAQPVTEATPVEQTLGQCFHIGQNGSTGGGETGDDLEKGIDEIGDLPGYEKGEATEKTQYDPAGANADHAFPGIQSSGGLSAKSKQQEGGHGNGGHGDEKTEKSIKEDSLLEIEIKDLMEDIAKGKN